MSDSEGRCTEVGFICDSNGHITHVVWSANQAFHEHSQLGDNGVRHQLPAFIVNSPALQSLDLSYSDAFTGPMPLVLGLLTKFDISFTGFVGPIPVSFYRRQTELEYLDMTNTAVTGPISSEVGGMLKLRHLALAGTSLTGDIPSSITALEDLTVLDLSGLVRNSFAAAQVMDHVPMCSLAAAMHFDKNTNGWKCDGDGVPLSPVCGGWPGVYCAGPFVVGIAISSGQVFRGSIPTTIGLFKSLLYLSINDANLEGPIPSSIESLTSLQYLDLKSNKLTGSVPSALAALAALRYLTLASNDLEGRLPDSITKMTGLYRLAIGGNNRVTGSIPDTFGQLFRLTHLDFSATAMTGPVPVSLCQLKYLSLFQTAASHIKCYNACLGSNVVTDTDC